MVKILPIYILQKLLPLSLQACVLSFRLEESVSWVPSKINTAMDALDFLKVGARSIVQFLACSLSRVDRSI